MTPHQHDPASHPGQAAPAGNGTGVNGKEMAMDARLDYLGNP
jgi:hypothetical protein